ncbi:MAG: hypothetical protein CL944_01105 [Candidatus Diapherotrites archaeon]|uniref:Molybdate/tungstate import ATP-binding protein WtpC n=1 Tax=Candidatus Iainarchaeum sp. TaxID=3101447 RepID=A0A2D6LPD5_9ARCH|nr:hypothetical protein [Candidatus Diapherotrites archaeon]|tara:strand:- start:2900 stop:3718 length:819 start_codon:yes stop_codon:yes gene_type:complete
MKLKIEKINLVYSDWKMKNLSLEIQEGSFTAIVGPSGSGKTTLLRSIAGLENPVSGNIFFNETNVTNFPSEERNVGFVFQGDSLFSHLNVFDNVAFGIKMKKQANVLKKVKEALKLVHLSGFEKRKVNNLSGGEKKRVAIARAIAFQPELLLLDEPLNGLDAPLKEKMKLFLKELQKKTGLTMIFVSHDIDEAFFLSDKIIVMNSGKIEQSGFPVEIFSKPKNSFVKNFVNDYVLIKAKKKGKNLEAKFKIPVKGKGKAFVNLKKTNYKFVE